MTPQEAFSTQLEFGRKGEQIVKHVLGNRGWEVVDVRNSQHYRRIDVDFRLHKENLHLSLEVKRDSYISYTNNVAVEIHNSNNRRRDGRGWIFYTESDLIAYISANTNQMWVLQTVELREYTILHLPHTEKRTEFKEGEFGINFLINLQDYMDHGYSVQQIEY